VPTKLREVRSFIGLCSFCRYFIQDFSIVAASSRALTKKNQPFRWSEECQYAFDLLKQRLTSAPVLALPRDECQYILGTDASNHGVEAVLLQVQDGEERVIAYSSQLYSASDQRYCVPHEELVAVIYAVKKYRHYSAESFHHRNKSCGAAVA
jgi:hypothetical protein